MSAPPFPDMDELIQRLLDDQIEPDEMQRLAKAIREDPQVRDYYVDSLLVSAVIRRSSQVTGELSKSDLIRAIADGAGQSGPKRLGRRILSIAALLALGALVWAALRLLPHGVQGPAVGTLAGEYEADVQRLSGMGMRSSPSRRASAHRPLRSARRRGENRPGSWDGPSARSSMPDRTGKRG